MDCCSGRYYSTIPGRYIDIFREGFYLFSIDIPRKISNIEKHPCESLSYSFANSELARLIPGDTLGDPVARRLEQSAVFVGKFIVVARVGKETDNAN